MYYYRDSIRDGGRRSIKLRKCNCINWNPTIHWGKEACCTHLLLLSVLIFLVHHICTLLYMQNTLKTIFMYVQMHSVYLHVHIYRVYSLRCCYILEHLISVLCGLTTLSIMFSSQDHIVAKI